LQIKTKIVSCHTADSKPIKQKVNGTNILPPLVFPDLPKNKRLGWKGLTRINTLAYHSALYKGKKGLPKRHPNLFGLVETFIS
jgi:hypothetical protein